MIGLDVLLDREDDLLIRLHFLGEGGGEGGGGAGVVEGHVSPGRQCDPCEHSHEHAWEDPLHAPR